jgi:hypothetical protein
VSARVRLTLRAGLVFYTLVQTLVGGWMLVSPRSFYDDVPWVAMFPPYNQHLMTDLGALNLAVALVFGVAAVSLDRLLVRAILVGYLLYAVPHLVFHSTHLAGFGAFAATIQTVLQTVLTLLPLGLLALTRSPRQTG